jgi:hypothetical protein
MEIKTSLKFGGQNERGRRLILHCDSLLRERGLFSRKSDPSPLETMGSYGKVWDGMGKG